MQNISHDISKIQGFNSLLLNKLEITLILNVSQDADLLEYFHETSDIIDKEIKIHRGTVFEHCPGLISRIINHLPKL